MNAQERILATIKHEEADKVPAFETTITNNSLKQYYGLDIDGGLGAILVTLSKLGKMGEELLQKGLKDIKTMKQLYQNTYEFLYRARLDLVLSTGSLYPVKILPKGEGYIDEYGRIMKSEIYVDDNGIETQISGYYGGYFNNFEDYEEWEPLNPHDEERIINFKAGKEIQEEMKNKVFSIPAIGAMMECSWEGFGIESFSKILAKSSQASKVFDDRGKFTLELTKIYAEMGSEIVLLWDDYGYKNGLFMSPVNYRKYVFPWLKRICDAAHKQGCKIMLHSDGDLMEIFDDIINCGVDILNPIEPTTANPDYDIFKLKQKYGEQLTFSGNVSPILLAMGRIEEIQEYSMRLIKEVAPGGGFIFGSGHSINPAIPVAAYEAMHDIREKFGKYPINI